MFCGQVFWLFCGLLFDHVPLSCVPPWTSLGFRGLMVTLMNWSVLYLRLMCVIRLGTFDSIRWQFAILAGPSGRSFVLHRKDKSPNVPSVRITPPSEPSKICVGFDG